jgi:DNA-binding response OmpR family regulator
MRILIIEDEKRLANALKELLTDEKYLVDAVLDGKEGYEYALTGIYDLVVLDLMLPSMDGFEIARNLREKKVDTPILILTARDLVEDKVRGLDCGADDYMTKPFATEEFLARVRAITRRKGEVILDYLTFKDLSLDLERRQIICGEKSVHLNYKEFEILKLLMTNESMVFSKNDIIVKIWGYESDATDNNVEAYISFIRKKINYIGSTVEIETIRKVGYRIC